MKIADTPLASIPKPFNNSERIANILIKSWCARRSDSSASEEKVKHKYDALIDYSCPASDFDIAHSWEKILAALKKNNFNQVKQLIRSLMTCELPSAVKRALEESYSYDRNDDRFMMELSIKESEVMLDNALQYDGEFCLVIDRAIKLNKNIIKIEATDWSVLIGDGHDYYTLLEPLPPDVKTHWTAMTERSYLYLIEEKRLIEI